MREVFDDDLENSAKALRGLAFLIEVGNGERLLTVTSARGGDTNSRTQPRMQFRIQ